MVPHIISLCDTRNRVSNNGSDFHAYWSTVRTAHGTPNKVARIWAELTWQLIWRPSHVSGEFLLVASAGLVLIVLLHNYVAHCENVYVSDGRSVLYGRLCDHPSVAGRASLESALFSLPNIGDWAQSRHRTYIDQGGR